MSQSMCIDSQRDEAWLVAPGISSCGTVSRYDDLLYPGVSGLAALTIDDVPCGQNPSACMVTEVRKLLAKFEAQATFFVTAAFVPGNEDDMVSLISDGHEIANHCMWDCPYTDMSAETFEEHLTKAQHVCDKLKHRTQDMQKPPISETTQVAPSTPTCCFSYFLETRNKRRNSKPHASIDTCCEEAMTETDMAVRWFRAPGGLTNSDMNHVLERLGYMHVLGDCVADDPYISDPGSIADMMLERAVNGSIFVLQMPERGFREYNLHALHLLLEGLAKRGLKAVTLSALHDAARKPVTSSQIFNNPTLNVSNEPQTFAKHLDKTSNVFKGIATGTVCIVGGVLEGVKGVIGKPIAGALENGATGFVHGLGNGLFGVISKPINGVLKGAGEIVGGIRATV